MKSYRQGIEALENRKLMAASPFRITSTDVRLLADSDGTVANANTVTVKFTGDVATVDPTKIRMFGYANNTLDGGQTKKTIGVVSATVSGKSIIITTGVRVRKGATVTLNTGSVTDVNGDDLTGTIRTKKGDNRDRFTLALRAFTPGDKTKFSNVVLTGGSAPITVNTVPTENSVLTALTAFLTKKVSGGYTTEAKKTLALSEFNDANNKILVPAPNLRAAICSLVGTIGEPAINFYFHKANTTGKDLIEFDFDGDSFSSGARISETTYTSSGRLKTTWNPNYAGESFVVLSGLVAHETVHEGTDQINSQEEEVVANSIENVIYAQQAVVDYTYTNTHTTLTARANYHLLLLLNSGNNQFPRVGVSQAPLVTSDGASPGFTEENSQTSTASFEANVRKEFEVRLVPSKPSTASYPTARQILTNLTGNTYTSATTYGTALIRDIDIGQDTLGDKFVNGVARVLQVHI